MSFHAAEISRSQLGHCPSDVGLSVIRGEGERVTLLPFGSSVPDALNIRQKCMANTQREIHTYPSGSPLGLLTNNDWPQLLMLVKKLGGTLNCPVDGGEGNVVISILYTVTHSVILWPVVRDMFRAHRRQFGQPTR